MSLTKYDVLQRPPDFDARLTGLALARWKWRLLDSVDGVRTIEAVAAATHFDLPAALTFAEECLQSELLTVEVLTRAQHLANAGPTAALPAAGRAPEAAAPEPSAVEQATSPQPGWEPEPAVQPEREPAAQAPAPEPAERVDVLPPPEIEPILESVGFPWHVPSDVPAASAEPTAWPEPAAIAETVASADSAPAVDLIAAEPEETVEPPSLAEPIAPAEPPPVAAVAAPPLPPGPSFATSEFMAGDVITTELVTSPGPSVREPPEATESGEPLSDMLERLATAPVEVDSDAEEPPTDRPMVVSSGPEAGLAPRRQVPEAPFARTPPADVADARPRYRPGIHSSRDPAADPAPSIESAVPAERPEGQPPLEFSLLPTDKSELAVVSGSSDVIEFTL